MNFENVHAGQIVEISGGADKMYRMLDAGVFLSPLPDGRYLIKSAQKEMLVITEWYYGTAYDDGDPFIITNICRLDWGGTIEALAANRQGLKSVVHILFRGRERRA